MTPIEFLRAVWPDEGLYCIATPLPIRGYKHDVFNMIEDAATFVGRIIDEQNIFFGTHTLKEPSVWDPHHHRDKDAEGRPWVGGLRVRSQLNSKASRIFFFDLDVEAGNEKKYSNQESAFAGLRAFVAACGLPIPMVVSSGGGLHVYWILDVGIASDAWVPIAAKLKQLAHHYGLKIDDARTTDTASVLRVAGTFNHKGNPDVPGTHSDVDPKRPVLVYKNTTPIDFGKFTALVDAAIDDAEIVVKKPRTAPKPTTASKLGINTASTFDGPQPSMQALIEACPQIARIANVEGKTSHEPEWYATAGSLNYVLNGRKHFHHISSGHPDYDEDLVDAKFDQWTEKVTGPASCEKMEDSCGVENAHLCRRCKWRTEAKFPVRAAELIKKAPPPVVVAMVAGVEVEIEIANPPLPWKRSREHGVTLIAETKEGRAYEKKVYPYDLYPLERSTSHDRKSESQQWRVHLPHGDTRDITIPASTFVDDRSLRPHLAEHGVYTSNFEEVKAYMSAYIQELQRLNPTSSQHNHLGWVENNTRFVFPTKIIQPDGSDNPTHLAKSAATAAEFMTQRGTLQKQVELLRFYQDRRYVAQQFFILSSLGSPLLFATGHDGFVVHAYGETGGSKSSALLTAASFWGNPKQYVLNCTDDGATKLYRTGRLGILNNMPLCLDEVTGIKEDVAKDFALGSSQSTGHSTMRRDSTPKGSLTGNERSSIIMSTANKSLQSLLAINNSAGVAAAMRVLDIHFDHLLRVHRPMEAEEYLIGLYENYGWIGENYMRVVVAKLDKVRAAILRKKNELADRGSQVSHERFWFSDATAAFVAGDIVRKLEYVVYDLDYMQDWFLKEQLPQMRGGISDELEASSPLAVLMDYFSHINPNILQTKKHPGMPKPNVLPEFRGQLLAHHMIEQNIIHVLKQDFRIYCQRRGRYSQEILRILFDEGIIISLDRKIALGEGTDLAKGRAWCFTVNLAHPKVATIMPELVVQTKATSLRLVK
jgi:hypothetical protein